MEKRKAFYITTTIPYVNADPHIGFAVEAVQADVLARHYRLLGHEVFFNQGADEHGQKILEKANETGEDVQQYVDRYAAKVRVLKKTLNLSNDTFIRTTDQAHKEAAQELWRRCEKDIEKKKFKGLYCVGCEKYLTQRDLENGKCPLHPKQEPVELEEENYFFKLTNYQGYLEKYLEGDDVIIPKHRLEEARQFVKNGLEDFSISRERKRMEWGVSVPGDESQVMYVWFDALTNYISTLGWPEDKEGKYKKFWENGQTIQMAGKDQIRFQSIMWQAMLKSAGLPATDQIFYHGFVNSGGHRMSKSLGNVIRPDELVKRYGVDAARYLLLRHVHPTDDTDVTWERLDEWYTANLVNGLGNFVARVMKMAEDNLGEPVKVDNVGYKFPDYVEEKLSEFRFDSVADYAWSKIAELDLEIQEKKPWESKDKETISTLVIRLHQIGRLIEPFMPDTSETILKAVQENKKPGNLFPRLA